MNKTYWLSTKEIAAITTRLDYVDGISAGPLGSTLSQTDEEFAKVKSIMESLKRGDQLFVTES